MQMEQNKQVDEDLLLVLKTFSKGIAFVLKPVNLFFIYTLKHIGTISLFSLLGVSLFAGFHYFQRPYYKSTLCISHQRLENDFCLEMINSLKSLAGEPNNEEVLSKKFGLSKKYIHELKSITHLPLNESITKLYSDTIGAKLPFKVKVEVYDVNVLDSIQMGILHYLESNEYVTKVKSIDSMLLAKKEHHLIADLNELDSLKLIVNKSILPQSTGTGIILGEPINPVTIYNTSNYLYELKLQTHKKQLLNKSFEVMVGFTANARPAGTGRLVFLLLGLLFGYLMGFIFLVRKKHIQ
jgi:hypothetical protein